MRDSSNRSLALVNDEIKALELEIEPPPGTFNHKEEADFWLELPRTFSFTSARFELPLDMSSLVNMTPVEYLSKHVTITSSRRQLYDKVKQDGPSLESSSYLNVTLRYLCHCDPWTLGLLDFWILSHLNHLLSSYVLLPSPISSSYFFLPPPALSYLLLSLLTSFYLFLPPSVSSYLLLSLPPSSYFLTASALVLFFEF